MGRTDRLLNNPWAQPPLPSDWEVHPTYPKHAVPYYLAPLWDAKLAAKQVAENTRAEVTIQQAKGENETQGKVAKELKEKLKKAKVAKGFLQALEEEVRGFIKDWEEKLSSKEEHVPNEVDSEDEEIVFVGRNGQMHDMPSPRPRDEKVIKHDQLIFDSAADDRGASFGYSLSFTAPSISSTDFVLGAGLFTLSAHTTDFAPGLSPSATRQDERLT